MGAWEGAKIGLFCLRSNFQKQHSMLEIMVGLPEAHEAHGSVGGCTHA